MDLKEQVALMEHAKEFTNSATEHLQRRLGHPPSEQEMLIFCSAVGSMNASWCYAKVYENGGREPADTWMQQIFVQTGVGVQARGVPVTLQINLKSIPMGGDAAEQGVIDQGHPVVICKCVTDAQGQCAACLKELHDSLSHIIDVAATLEEFKSRERCKPCLQRLFDPVFAKVIQEKFGSVGQTVRDMITAMAVQMGAASGVTEMPQIEAALTAGKKKE